MIILSSSLRKHVDKLIIDKDYDYPMQYPVKEKDDTIVMKRSDHLTLILHLKNLPTCKRPKIQSRETRWNYNRKGKV